MFNIYEKGKNVKKEDHDTTQPNQEKETQEF